MSAIFKVYVGAALIVASTHPLCAVLRPQYTSPPSGSNENVLIIVADDVGVDLTPPYAYVDSMGAPLAPPSATIDRLASEGMLFRNAWSSPVCSSSRAQALSGKYPNRTGIGRAVYLGGSPSDGIRDDELFLGDIVPPTYRRAAIGKWHLGGTRQPGTLTGGIDHAPRCGFDLFAGTKGNLVQFPETYFDWKQILSVLTNLAATHTVSVHNQYATTRTTDDALRAIESFGDDPWLLWVSYHAAHKPFHIPPSHLLQSTNPDFLTDRGKGLAMVEALDTEIGRLLSDMPPGVLQRTTVIYFGDNGTEEEVVVAPFDPAKAKRSLYQGGIHIPFIVMSRHIPEEHRGSTCDSIIDLTDLMPTVAGLVGVPRPHGIDGRSLLPLLLDPAGPPLRPWVFAEYFTPNFVPVAGQTISQVPLQSHKQAVRNTRHKLIRRRTFTNGQLTSEEFELYDLEVDEFELQDLIDYQGNPPPELQSTYDALLRVLLAQSA